MSLKTSDVERNKNARKPPVTALRGERHTRNHIDISISIIITIIIIIIIIIKIIIIIIIIIFFFFLRS